MITFSKVVIRGKTAPMWLFSAVFFFSPPQVYQMQAFGRPKCAVCHLRVQPCLPGDKPESMAEFLCRIMTSSPPLNCNMQLFLFTGGLMAPERRWSHSRPRLSLGFPPLLHIIDGASHIGAGNWNYLAADKSGDYYFCGLPRRLGNADGFYYCVCSPVGSGGARAAVSSCSTSLNWEQERSEETKINIFCELHFTSEGCIHQEEAAMQGRGVCFLYFSPELWDWGERRACSVRKEFTF